MCLLARFEEWSVERSLRRQQRHKEQQNRPQHPLLVWFRALGNGDRDTARRNVIQSPTQPEHSPQTEAQAIRLNALVELFKLCGERVDAELMEKVLQEAVTKDHFIILVWAHVQGTGGWSPKLMDLAVELGRFQIVKWLHKYRFVGCTTAAMDAAAGDGRLDIVEWLHQHRYEGCTTEAMDRAVANGHMEVVKFLHEKRHEGCTVEAFEEAIKRRDVEIVKFLYRGRPELSEWPQPEHSTILKDLLLSWHPLDKEMLDYITSRRQERYLPFEHTEPTEYDEKQELENHGRPQSGMIYGLGRVLFVLNRKVPHFYWDYIGGIITQYLIRDPRTFVHPIEAATNGYVYWLAQYGPLGSGHLRWLVRRGWFDQARRMHELMTKTMLKRECDDHFKLMTMEHGDLAYIKWHIRNCRSMGFEEIVHQAVWTGRKDVIRWIQTRYITVKKSTSGGARWRLEPSLTYMDCAAAENDLATVKGLHAAQGDDAKCTTKAMDLAAANGHLEMVQWLNKHRSEGCTTDAMDVAASNGHLEVLKWLYRYRREGYTSLAIDGAAANGRGSMALPASTRRERRAESIDSGFAATREASGVAFSRQCPIDC